ncbi:hypothetical protein Tco_0849063 [Tanacetum coccineum]
MSRSLLVPEFSQVSTMNNLKFVFMFNGKLMQCIQSGELRYVDGEERVVCVDRNILLSRLVSMVIELHHCSYRDKNNPFSFVLFYGVEQAEDCLFAPLTCDKDVKCMVDKYYRILETLGRYYAMRLGYGADVNGGRRCLEFALNEPDKVREYLDNCRNSGGKIYYVLDPKLPPIPANPVPEPSKPMDEKKVYELEKQRMIRKEDETLCCGHIKNSLSDTLYDL